MNIAISGSNGYLGKRIRNSLIKEGYKRLVHNKTIKTNSRKI
jgi:nucleoside-diphosphate-sugar epimerase